MTLRKWPARFNAALLAISTALLLYGLYMKWTAYSLDRFPVNLSHIQAVIQAHSSSSAETQTSSRQHGRHGAHHDRPVTFILATMLGDDTAWTAEHLKAHPDDTIVISIGDDRAATQHPPVNKGREAMQYLSYLIDHYDHLPDMMIFMHAHRHGRHNNSLLRRDMARMMQLLRRDYVARRGFTNLWCDWTRGCPDHLDMGSSMDSTSPRQDPRPLRYDHITRAKQAFGELFPDQPRPRLISAPGGGQFAVTKETVLRVPLARLHFLRDWILQTPLNSYDTGQIFEFFWHMIFLGSNEAVLCPDPALCYCNLYGVCLDHWTGGSDLALERMAELRELEAEINNQTLVLNQLSGLTGVADPVVLQRQIQRFTGKRGDLSKIINAQKSNVDEMEAMLDRTVELAIGGNGKPEI